jgi:hypothetical protein
VTSCSGGMRSIQLSYGRGGIGKRNKPSSVSDRGRRRAISLRRRSPVASSSLPGTSAAFRPHRRGQRLRPCLALLRVGFTMPLPLPAARWSLTPPFHPCLCSTSPAEPSAVCFLRHFPAPLGVRVLPGTLPCGARTFLDRPEGRPRLALASRSCQTARPAGAGPAVRPGGVEPPTFGSVVRRSIQLSYGRSRRKNRPRPDKRPAGSNGLPRTALKS